MKRISVLREKVKDFIKDNYLILVLVILFFLIKAPYLLKAHNIIWDEAVYMGMGKYLFSSGNLGFWEIVRPIGLPLILGLIWKSGFNYVLFSEFISILFSVGCIIFTYLIGKEMVNKEVGVISSSILAITSVFFLYTNYILTGIPSTFFVLFGIYVYLKKHNLLVAGILCGIGALFRFPQALIGISFILALFISLLRDRDMKSFLKKSSLFSFGFLLSHIPFLIFNYFIYNKETSRIYHALFRPWILGTWAQFNPAESIITGTWVSYLYNIFYYVIELLKENTLFIFIIPGLIFILSKKIKKRESFNVIVATFFIYFLYFTYISNKQTRFLIVFLPYASLIAAYGFYYSFLHSKKDRIRIAIVIFVIISLVGVINRDLNYYNWRLKEELPIVGDYYKFFVDKEIKGAILTTDPVPAVYVDAKFVPFFFSPDLGHKVYALHRNETFAIILIPESFYCSNGDKECKKRLNSLFKLIEDENELVFSEIYGDRAYHIYLSKRQK
ncbi:glycosyltransferase family 39 protein [Candidatus Woesearchaeota archaeon]|nr:glycosyltransferase family 39 protein [Candidatus Woesearchaeota archaeon]